MEILGKGLLMGLVLAIGVGPVTMLCLQRAFCSGRRVGLWTGAGAAVADIFFAVVVGFGLAAVSGFIERHATWIQLGAAAVLIGWGARIGLSRPRIELEPACPPVGRLAAAFGGGLLLNLINPWNVVAYCMLGASLGIAEGGFELGRALLFVVGVSAGSMVWWSGVVLAASSLRRAALDRGLLIFHRVVGSAVALFGVVLAIR